MKISQAGIDLIKRHEQCRLKAYRDPAGIWTVGWGCTGPDITETTEWTQAEADQRLAARLVEFDAAVDRACPEMSQAQHDACTSLAFNIGDGAFSKSSVARLHNAGRYSEACQAFSLWNKAGGRVLIELVHRRAEEAAMYASGTTIPEEVKVDVPAQSDGPKPILLTKTMISTATAGLGTAASVVSQVQQQAQVVRDTADGIHDAVDTGFHLWKMFGNHLGIIALVLVVIGLLGVAYAKWTDHSSGRT